MKQPILSSAVWSGLVFVGLLASAVLLPTPSSSAWVDAAPTAPSVDEVALQNQDQPLFLAPTPL